MFMVTVIRVNVWVFIRYLYMSVSMWFMGDSASSRPGLVEIFQISCTETYLWVNANKTGVQDIINVLRSVNMGEDEIERQISDT